jgi:hypothetical protein
MSGKKQETVEDAHERLLRAIAAHPDSANPKWVEFGEKVEKKGMSSHDVHHLEPPPRNLGLSSLGLTTTKGRKRVEDTFGQLKTAHTLAAHERAEEEKEKVRNDKKLKKDKEVEEKKKEALRRLTAEGIAERKKGEAQLKEVQEGHLQRNKRNQVLFNKATLRREEDEKKSGVVPPSGSYGKYKGGKTKRRRRNKRKGTKRKGTKRRKSKHRTRRRKGNQKKRTRKRR